MAEVNGNKPDTEEEVSTKIVTLPNIISMCRFLLIWVFLVLLIMGYDIAATIVFIVAAASDWCDGLIARRTHVVTRVGQIIDPAIDRLLIIVGVIGVLVVGRLPLWIFLVVLIRDAGMFIVGCRIMYKYRLRIPVIFLGKVATTFLYAGFAGQLLNWPILPGLALFDGSWLPGIGTAAAPLGIWLVYIGLVLLVITTTYYAIVCVHRVHEVKATMQESERP